ncbi:hypothetical protein PCANC_07646 [Puccinia coronata f. sp. avenae]|uniref:AN1-type domain-containing protein n=1 Tax=Puccinia coronata f. sp. avenae TaxID=200324 RepID=A0A2N5UTA3_9BASI|nr:hypothetical protein PCASD_19495 [Puccinia coronata f. sp. avenae]PLW19758.1 hypothetical protein PCANC_07646 [Puccinia coronata f. sp. avenae]PLW40964.1 hypothetical protein PCASD_06601 [Puccinia coronata f. sp. avenae]
MTDQNHREPSANNETFNAGTHCAKVDCRTLDFLPLVCPHCHLAFCSSHAHVFYHDCCLPEVLREARREEEGTTSTGDPVRELVNQHTPAPVETTKEDRNAKAKQILAARFPVPATRERQPKRPSKELSPALKLILLKRQAVGGDPRKKDNDVPLGCRWYGRLGCLMTTADSENLPWSDKRALAKDPKAIWFDKKTVVGKTCSYSRSALAINYMLSPTNAQQPGTTSWMMAKKCG